jgi:hypothetical protein
VSRSRSRPVVRIVGDSDQARACADRLQLARFLLDPHAADPDVLVVAPAPPHDGRALRDLPLGELDDVWQRTVMASLQAIQEALAAMVERGSGTVVLVVPAPTNGNGSGSHLPLVDLLATGALTAIVPVLAREVDTVGVQSVCLVAAAPRVTAEVVNWLVRPEPDSSDGPPVLMLDGETLLAGAVAQEYGLV